MNWFTWLVGTGLLVLASVTGNVLPTNKNCGTAPGSLTLNKIARKAGDKFDVCCDECTLGTSGKYLLGITGTDGILKTYDSVTVNDLCVEYDVEITTLANQGETLTIAMQHLDPDDCPINGNLVTIDSFPALPVTFTLARGPNPTSDTETDIKEIIRVQGDMGSYTFLEIELGYDVSAFSKDGTYYFITNNPPTLTPCDETNDIPVCDAPIVAATANYEAAITLKSATLQYQGDLPQKANFIADTSSVEKQGKETLATTKFDMIIFSQNKMSKNLCINKDSGIMNCDINWSPGSEIADVRLVQIDDDIPVAYQKNPIQDREVLASPIGSTSIEARWLFMGDTDKLYKMIRSTELSSTDTEVIVDCSGVTTSDNCFGYFTGLNAGTYRIMIQSRVDGDYDAVSQIQSKTIDVPGSRALSNELKVHFPRLEWHHDSDARATICFNNNKPNAARSFSHYEFVIINNKGQWLKHKNMTQDTSGDICFAPLYISTETFDVSEGATLIVTQRAEDGFTVLAEGETYIDFKRT